MKDKQKHLEFIQNVINRIAGNLFLLRGWTITLTVTLLALSPRCPSRNFVFIAYLPVITFWILDGYFLSQERLFRALYNRVRKLDEKQIDFSMDANPYKKNKKNGCFCSMFSTTPLFFYIPLIAITSLLTFFIK